MRILFIIILCIPLCFRGLSQDRNVIDSLKKVIVSIEKACPEPCPADTARINAYNEWYMEISLQEPDSAQQLAFIAEDIAEKLLAKYPDSEITNTIKKHLSIAKNNIGYIYSIKSDIPKALEYYTKSLKLKEETGDKGGIATSFNNIGSLYETRGNIPKALEYHNKSLDIRVEIDDKHGIANSLSNIGVVYDNQGDFTKALEYYNKSLDIREEIGDERGISLSYNNIGLIYNNRGDIPKALEYYNKSVAIKEEIGDKVGLGYSLNNIGYIYSNQGDMQKALEYYTKSLDIRKEIGDKQGMANTYNNLGSVYNKLGDIQKALEHYTKCLNICEETGFKKGISYSLNNLGSIYNDQGNIPKALEYYNKSIDIREEIGDKQGMFYSLSNVASVYRKQGEIPKALEYYTKCLNICEKIGFKKGIADTYNSFGLIYHYQGDIPKALENFLKCLKMYEETGDKKGMATSYNNIGYMYKDRDDMPKALEYYTKSLNIYEEIGYKNGVALSFNNIGYVYEDRGNMPKALEYYKKSLNINEEIEYKNGVITSLCELGRGSRKQNDILQFEKYAARGYKLSKELGYPENIKNAASLMKDLSIKQNNYVKADSFALEVIDINNKAILLNFATLPETGQEKYFKKVASGYMDFNSYALNRKQENPDIVSHVYNNTIKNKGLLLKSSTAMRNAVLNSEDTVIIANYYKWIHLKKKMAKLYSKGKDTGELEKQANEFEKELVKGSQLFSDFKKLQNISWKDLQKNLKPNEAAIEFVHFKYKNYDGKDFTEFTDSTLYCALIVKSGSKYPEMVQLFEEKQLQKILGKFSGNNYNYINRIYGKNNEYHGELYNLIWKPVEQNLKGIKTVYLSPTGLLHKVSFSAIAKEQNIYLCDSYDIKVQSSTGKIAMPESFIFDTELTAALFGGINYNSDSTTTELWKYLEGTRTETKKIKDFLIKKNVNVHYFTDNSATEEKFKAIAGKSNLLHISTHGFFYPDPELVKKETEKTSEDEEVIFRGGDRGFGIWSFVKNKRPLMRSGLVFAGANDVWNRQSRAEGEDGVLTAQEVAHIDMRKTGLAVMSACETGLGDIKGSEGVYGLQRAFKMAGVKFIIMSLWQVPDKETEEFMTTFYTKLFDLKDIRKAFSVTQKEMRKKYDPYFWAAFVLVE